MLITLILIQVSTTTVRDVIFSSSADTHVQALRVKQSKEECVCVCSYEAVCFKRQTTNQGFTEQARGDAAT